MLGLINQGQGFQPINAGFHVSEAFAEAVAPIVADEPLLHELSIESAVRFSRYDTIGNTTTWKAGGMWAPVADIKFRIMRAHSVRAPSLSELYNPGVLGYGTNVDPCSAQYLNSGSPYRVANCRAAGIPVGWSTPRPGYAANTLTGGNPNLDPETSNSWTAGIVLTPRFAPRLSLSIDYWRIDIAKAVSQIDSLTTATKCYDSASLDNPFCALITRGTTLDPHEISVIDVTNVNVGRLFTDGIDFTAAYSLPMSSLRERWPGTVHLSLAGTYLRSLEQLVDASDPTLAGHLGRRAGPSSLARQHDHCL